MEVFDRLDIAGKHTLLIHFFCNKTAHFRKPLGNGFDETFVLPGLLSGRAKPSLSQGWKYRDILFTSFFKHLHEKPVTAFVVSSGRSFVSNFCFRPLLLAFCFFLCLAVGFGFLVLAFGKIWFFLLALVFLLLAFCFGFLAFYFYFGLCVLLCFWPLLLAFGLCFRLLYPSALFVIETKIFMSNDYSSLPL